MSIKQQELQAIEAVLSGKVPLEKAMEKYTARAKTTIAVALLHAAGRTTFNRDFGKTLTLIGAYHGIPIEKLPLNASGQSMPPEWTQKWYESTAVNTSGTMGLHVSAGKQVNLTEQPQLTALLNRPGYSEKATRLLAIAEELDTALKASNSAAEVRHKNFLTAVKTADAAQVLSLWPNLSPLEVRELLLKVVGLIETHYMK